MTPREILGLSHAAAVAELSRLRGDLETPLSNCMHITSRLGGAKVLIEAEYEPSEHGGRDGPSWGKSWAVTDAFVNGSWVGADQFAPHVSEAWHKAVIAHLQKMMRDREYT